MTKSRKQILKELDVLEHQIHRHKHKSIAHHELSTLTVIGALASAFLVGWKGGQSDLLKKGVKTVVRAGVPIAIKIAAQRFIAHD